MTVSGDQSIELLSDALRKAWWVPSGVDDLPALRRAALSVFASALTPTRRFLQLLEEGAFAEAEGVLASVGDSNGALGELPDAGKRLAAAREEAVRRTTTVLDALRRRSERLGQTWDEDLAGLLLSTAEDDEREVIAELRYLADSVSNSEKETAATLIAAGELLGKSHAEHLRDLLVEKQWDAARHLVDHGRAESAVSDRPTTPAFARLGVSPTTLVRSFARGHNPGRPSDGWRDVDQELMDVIARILTTGPAPALAEALRCTVRVDGDTTSLHAVFDGARAETIVVTTVHLRSTSGIDEVSVVLDGSDAQGRLSLERSLQVLLSPGDRTWQLLRAIVDGWTAGDILSLTRSSAPVIDRIEAVLDLALRSPQTGLATVVAHRAGFNMALAKPLLAVVVPLARRDGHLSSDEVDAAMLDPTLIAEWQRVMAEFAHEHRDAYLLVSEAASNNTTIVDSDLLALLADVAGVQSLDAAVLDLKANGFAAEDGEGELVLHIEPLRIARDLRRGITD